VASLQASFERMLHQLSEAESKCQTAETRASEAENRSEALAAALNESRSRCVLEQQQNHSLQLQSQRFEAESQSSALLSSQLAAAEASLSDLQQKFHDADKRAFVAERRADALVQELRVCAFAFARVLVSYRAPHFSRFLTSVDQASVMSYSLELEAASSIRMNSADVRTAADAVTRVALDDSQLRRFEADQSASRRSHRSSASPSPPPPPPLDDDSHQVAVLSKSLSTAASAAFSDSSRLHALASASPSFTPQPVLQDVVVTSASAAAAAAPPPPPPAPSPSRYPSFDQWVTFKESSFNFGSKSSSTSPQSLAPASRRPPPSLQSHSSDPASAAVRAVSSRAFASQSQSKQASPSSVSETDEPDNPEQLYMRAISLQQARDADNHVALLSLRRLTHARAGSAAHTCCSAALLRCRLGAHFATEFLFVLSDAL
jgi:hypothetical protein